MGSLRGLVDETEVDTTGWCELRCYAPHVNQTASGVVIFAVDFISFRRGAIWCTSSPLFLGNKRQAHLSKLQH